MHAIQRQLRGLVAYDPLDLTQMSTAIANLGDTGLWVPVLDEGRPASAQRIGWSDHATGLVISELEADDELMDLLRREGVGRVAALAWGSSLFYAGAHAVAPTSEEAVTALGTFLESSWPRAAVIAECAAQKPGPWQPDDQRVSTGGIVVAPPTARRESKPMVRWQHQDGDLGAGVWALPSADWRRRMSHVLDTAPNGVGAAVREGFRLAGRRDVLKTTVEFHGMTAELAVEDPAGERPAAG